MMNIEKRIAELSAMPDGELNQIWHETQGLRPEIRWDNSKCFLKPFGDSDEPASSKTCKCEKYELYPDYVTDPRLWVPVAKEIIESTSSHIEFGFNYGEKTEWFGYGLGKIIIIRQPWGRAVIIAAIVMKEAENEKAK